LQASSHSRSFPGERGSVFGAACSCSFWIPDELRMPAVEVAQDFAAIPYKQESSSSLLPPLHRAVFSNSSGRGGFKPPSYHVNFNGGINPRVPESCNAQSKPAGKSLHNDQLKLASTLGRRSNFNTLKMVSNCRNPYRPARHTKSHPTLATQREIRVMEWPFGAGPSHTSQFNSVGTACPSLAASIPAASRDG